jgi:hypothetical protein
MLRKNNRFSRFCESKRFAPRFRRYGINESYYNSESGNDMNDNGAPNGNQQQYDDGSEDMDMDMDMGNMGGQQSNGGNNGQQNAADNADGLVIQIRSMALQGLELLANDIENPAYELFKKVWIMCDKAQQPDDDEISNE